MTDQSQEAILKPLMMTHQLRRGAAWKIFFFQKNFPRDTHLKMISALWGIILSHMLGYLSPPPPPPNFPCQPGGRRQPVGGSPSQEPRRGGGPGKGLDPPPLHKPIFPQPSPHFPRRPDWQCCLCLRMMPTTGPRWWPRIFDLSNYFWSLVLPENHFDAFRVQAGDGV